MVQEAPTSSPVAELWLPLKEVANVSLYRNNAFRVLGLSITATTSDIRKRRQALDVNCKVGIADTSQQNGYLPLATPPDANLVRRAVQRLSDPVQKLIDELFWFWSASFAHADSDTGLQLLAAGHIARAITVWESRLADPSHRSIARHNLAVLHHALALDDEQAENDSRTTQLGVNWNAACQHWSALLADESFWGWIHTRIRYTDDPRLTLDTLEQLRHGLPLTLITPNVTFAIQAMKRNDLPKARRHHGYMVGCSLGMVRAPILLENELRSVRDDLKTKCERAISQVEETPVNGNTIVEQLLNDARPAYDGLLALLSKNSYLVISASDILAGAIRSCIVAFGNATHNWERCRALTTRIQRLAQDPDIRSRIEADIKQLDENIREAKEQQEIEALRKAIPDNNVYEVTAMGTRITIPQVCPCCLGPADGNQTVSYSWQEDRGSTRYQRTISYEFPTCANCRTHRNEYAWKRWLPPILASAASTVMMLLLATFIDGEPTVAVAAGAVLTVLLVFGINSLLRIRPLSPEHACRAEAVYISGGGDGWCVLAFHNPLYARAFARGNDRKQKVQPRSKPSRTWRILSGRDLAIGLVVAVLVAGMAHFWIWASIKEEWRRQDSNSTANVPASPSTPVASAAPSDKPGDIFDQLSRQPPPRTPAAQPAPYTPPAPVFSGPSLSSRIAALKETIRLEEQSISKLDADSDSTSAKLNTLAAEIEQFEKKDAAGLYVNRTLYQNVIDEHNAIVRTHNALLADRRATYAEYSRAIDSVNDMVRRYNAGQR